ncbi:conserved hypothetical protein, ribA/ribD-fused [Bradyrhizobium brasilense]|uniref:NADAR domain-containing protein n=1 Tax=Bradyrhizobium brasilense TaxID=1419277 RepID=A0A1G6IM79_9BRAD|nr:NADAR family protein [Bradyrhizobium brasilense]SDC07574.1 conserved hypothetical protein, ribA/ribD-fused [Bradyrhizobium brasilense]
MSGACTHCRFFEVKDSTCRLNPPVRLPRRFDASASAGSRVREETLIWGWAVVDKNGWCGQWRSGRRSVDEPGANGAGCIKPDTDRQVFFYEQDFYLLSNFSAFKLRWKGLDFDTSEAAYHWEKFPGDDDVDGVITRWDLRESIRWARSAHEAFKTAESYKSARRPDWDAIKVDIMRDILRAKAAQHEYVRRKLLATGERELIEDSWRDDFWGWGPNRDGQNMLGKLWMQIRGELRDQPGGAS